MSGRAWLVVALGVLGASYLGWQYLNPPLRQYATFPSPDGRYRVVVYRTRARAGVLPGQGGDGEGVIRLEDQKGRVLRQTTVGLVRELRPLEWTAGSVRLPMIDEWPLPK